MKKLLLILVAVVVFLPQKSFADQYCVKSTITTYPTAGGYGGSSAPSYSSKVECFPSKESLGNATKNIIQTGGGTKKIDSFIIEKDGVITSHVYGTILTASGKQTYQDIDLHIGKSSLAYCVLKKGSEPICYSGQDACREAKTAALKTSQNVYNSCLGDGVIRDEAGEKISGSGGTSTGDVKPIGSGGSDSKPTDSGAGTVVKNTNTTVKLSNPLGNITNLNQLITRVVSIALQLALIVASLAILWSGFLFVKAQGKEKEITDARNRLMWTVIGLAIILGANVIVRIIETTIKSLGSGL